MSSVTGDLSCMAGCAIADITSGMQQQQQQQRTQNGQLKAKVNGANVPLLGSSIYELTPANAEIDELEENPFYLSKNASKDGSKGPDKHKSAKKK
uniref:Uncharacterized protein n=1 Tax=Tetradesmus obliquus TaxID=3088 RepID=A0A383WGL6_TETOB|eukprot:jgi/Sobl393_1/9532/SZX76550.1